MTDISFCICEKPAPVNPHDGIYSCNRCWLAIKPNAKVEIINAVLLQALEGMLEGHGTVKTDDYVGTCVCDDCTLARKAIIRATS